MGENDGEILEDDVGDSLIALSEALNEAIDGESPNSNDFGNSNGESRKDPNIQDKSRNEDPRARRNQRRENRSRDKNGQNKSGEGSRDHQNAKKGPSGKRPSGPDIRHNRERNRGIDEEHSRVPKGNRNTSTCGPAGRSC